ncbi:MAG: pantoate--beta-alanine ligase [Paenibacillaceae bacterium]|nr:pantoate--beta-alanine ligase [Paenibacillaceae bacterium]
MIVATTIEQLRDALAAGKKAASERGGKGEVGLVPTMGYLHEGHASLLQRARRENDVVALSIFVNPLQFGPNEDFARYPRDAERDLAIARKEGTDVVFMPDVTVMYPRPSQTTVSVSGLTESLCGASRPGHFDGVATVVSKLFHLFDPDRAYFGMKDAQQVAVVRQMADDLNFRVRIVPCPTLREPDGLAMSSRNVYLSPEEREQALVLSRALGRVDGWLAEPGITGARLRERILDTIGTAPLAVVDYVEAVTYPGLLPAGDWQPGDGTPLLLALAVKFGRTRLIDNKLIE